MRCWLILYIVNIWHSWSLSHNKEKSQHLLSIKHLSVDHEISIIISFLLNSLCDSYKKYQVWALSYPNLCLLQQLLSSQMVDLVFLYFTFHFYFHSVLFFYFLFLEQLGLGLISHAITSVTTWWHSHKTDHET